MTESTGTKPVLAEIPADFGQLTEDQQERFVADLAPPSGWAPGRRVVGRTGPKMIKKRR